MLLILQINFEDSGENEVFNAFVELNSYNKIFCTLF